MAASADGGEDTNLVMPPAGILGTGGMAVGGLAAPFPDGAAGTAAEEVPVVLLAEGTM